MSWNREGNGFIIQRPREFAEQVLTEYFGHKNLSSFTRQVKIFILEVSLTSQKLNLYGFQRSACEVNQCAFWHPLFLKNSSPAQLSGIRRRKRTELKKRTKNRPKHEVNSPYSSLLNVLYKGEPWKSIIDQNWRVSAFWLRDKTSTVSSDIKVITHSQFILILRYMFTQSSRNHI